MLLLGLDQDEKLNKFFSLAVATTVETFQAVMVLLPTLLGLLLDILRATDI